MKTSVAISKSLSVVKNWFSQGTSMITIQQPGTMIPAERGNDLSSTILPLQVQRIRQDAQTWRNGITEAEQPYFPQRVRIMEMYYDTILNGHVSACLDARYDLSLLREFAMVNDNGDVDEECTKIFKGKWFHDFMRYSLEAKMFGFSLVRIGDIENGIPQFVELVRRHNIYLGTRNEDDPQVVAIPRQIAGIPFTDPNYKYNGSKPFDWHVWVPSPSDIGVSKVGYGLLYKVAYYEIWLRMLTGFNVDYVQLFGQPLRKAKTNKKQNTPEYASLRDALAFMGSSGWLITDHDDEISLEFPPNSSVKNNPYENLEIRCENKISKLILGHEDALQSTPGKLGSEQGGTESPSQQALGRKQAADGRDLEYVVNDHLIPRLINLGVKIPNGLRWEFTKDAEIIESQKRADENNKIFFDGIQLLSSAGFEVDPKFIEDRTGIPVVKKDPIAMPGFDTGFSEMKNKLDKYYAE